MTTSPTSVIAHFREIDTIALAFARRPYENKPFEFKQKLIRQQTLKIIAAERVKMISCSASAKPGVRSGTT